jgi:transcription elongation factor GreA
MVVKLSPAEIAEYAQYAGARGVNSAKKLLPVKTFLAFLKSEGWIEIGLSSHLRVPRSRKTGTQKTDPIAAEGPSLSEEGYGKLVAQLNSLKEERTRVIEEIRLAMADKDFRENAPLDAAKERQGFIESKLRDLESTLTTAHIRSDKPTEPQQRIKLGATVTLKDVASGQQSVYTLVDVREADVASGKISTESPVGRALLNRAAGEQVSVKAPRGTIQYIVETIGS